MAFNHCLARAVGSLPLTQLRRAPLGEAFSFASGALKRDFRFVHTIDVGLGLEIQQALDEQR